MNKISTNWPIAKRFICIYLHPTLICHTMIFLEVSIYSCRTHAFFHNAMDAPFIMLALYGLRTFNYVGVPVILWVNYCFFMLLPSRHNLNLTWCPDEIHCFVTHTVLYVPHFMLYRNTWNAPLSSIAHLCFPTVLFYPLTKYCSKAIWKCHCWNVDTTVSDWENTNSQCSVAKCSHFSWLCSMCSLRLLDDWCL